MHACLCVCDLIKNASSCSDRCMNAALEDVGVSHCQSQVLMQILQHGNISMTALSKQLCCHKSNVTQIVDLLTERGCIERVASTTDKRVFTLKLKPKGKKILQSAEKVLHTQAEESLKVFTPEERQQFEYLLRKYIEKNSL